MKKTALILCLIFLFMSCALLKESQLKWQREAEAKELQAEYSKFRVDLTKHPDYNFSQTDAATIKIYDKGLTPLDQTYTIIGKLFVVELPAANKSLIEENIRLATSIIGGEGVVFIEETSEAANPAGSSRAGVVIPFSKMVFYKETTRDNDKGIIVRKAANVIRWSPD